MRSRADLRLINRLMGNYRWFERVLEGSGRLRSGFRVVEIGAGDGFLAKRLCRRFPGLRYDAVDLAPAPEDLPAACHWHQADLFEVLPALRGDALIANLFLHHFDDQSLRRIGTAIEPFPLLAFNEPWRRSRFHWAGYALRVLGINRVTRHDLHISINAGFRERELPILLGLRGGDVSGSLLGGYRWLRKK